MKPIRFKFGDLDGHFIDSLHLHIWKDLFQIFFGQDLKVRTYHLAVVTIPVRLRTNYLIQVYATFPLNRLGINYLYIHL